MKGISCGANISVMRLERKSSIESEPQTLSIHQIRYAREAALYVVNNRPMEEAIKIFTEGLQPVYIKSDMDDDGLGRLEDDQLNAFLFDDMIRDIVTAPF